MPLPHQPRRLGIGPAVFLGVSDFGIPAALITDRNNTGAASYEPYEDQGQDL